MPLEIVRPNPDTKAGHINFAFYLLNRQLISFNQFKDKVKKIRGSNELKDGDLSPIITFSESNLVFTIKTCAGITPNIFHKKMFHKILDYIWRMGFITKEEVEEIEQQVQEKFPDFPENQFKYLLQKWFPKLTFFKTNKS